MPKYLIPVAKPFAPTPSLGPQVQLGDYYHSPRTLKSTLELIERSGSNTGNFVFIESVIKHLGAANIGHDIDLRGRGREFVREHFAKVVVPSSNFIASHSSGYLEGLLPRLQKWGVPFVFVGLGTQLDENRSICKELEDALHHIADNSESIGVRGYFTAEFLNDLGIRNVDVIGCPSAFWRMTDAFELDAPRTLGDRPALVNAELNADSLRFLIKTLRRGDATIFQNEPLFFCSRDTGRLDREELIKYAPLDDGEFEYYNRTYYRQSQIFFNLAEWMDFASDFAFSCGPRFHGNMVALQAGVPALWFGHDWRTNELLEYLELPYIDPADADGMEIGELYERCSLDRFKRGFGAKLRNYVQFLEKNGLQHKFAPPAGTQPLERGGAAT